MRFMSPDRRERWLIQRLDRDPDAFHSLYEMYFGRVYSYVAAKVNDPRDAEDVVSDIFLQIIKALPQFRNQHHFSFAAWIFTIARNVIIDFYRCQGRNADDLQWDNLDKTTEDCEYDSRLIAQERTAELLTLLNRLTERRREILFLKYFSGLRNKEIAHVLNLDERTIASHLSRGLKDLHAIYTQQADINEGVVHDPSK